MKEPHVASGNSTHPKGVHLPRICQRAQIQERAVTHPALPSMEEVATAVEFSRKLMDAENLKCSFHTITWLYQRPIHKSGYF